ncbi:hypothetical protein GCM10010472_47360 [Pseudonocardia halophobica]|uniref:Uncharacterized protein n=1 Tax=Pseudonocardia halophobica TaxID=29401 RepID=A0A9W6L6W8_9PSEU|nr:hypothetical protein [Pseudonocardia halophobica]GLL13190.1 hypothetical protein GCM10017577_43330 [Pseudonocardia halophobica]
MSTTITITESASEGPEDPRRDAARPGPVQDRPVPKGPVQERLVWNGLVQHPPVQQDRPVQDRPEQDRPEQDPPAATSRPGVWASVLAGMDCYGYGLGYDYYTALHAANSHGPAPREAGAPRSRTGRTVAVAVGGILAAAAVAGGLIIGLGGHSTPSIPAATPHTGTATMAHGSGHGTPAVPSAHPAAPVVPAHPMAPVVPPTQPAIPAGTHVAP